jgi:hypothetical protein
MGFLNRKNRWLMEGLRQIVKGLSTLRKQLSISL